jgi:glutathione synthase
MIERSKAIKAPKIEYHLLGTKKFQEYISRPGIMEKYIKDKYVLDTLRGTFVKLYSFGSVICCFNKLKSYSNLSCFYFKDKDNKKLIEMMKTDYKNLVLKPQRECGGNNFFDEDIK